jgi:hypothetical protein
MGAFSRQHKVKPQQLSVLPQCSQDACVWLAEDVTASAARRLKGYKVINGSSNLGSGVELPAASQASEPGDG